MFALGSCSPASRSTSRGFRGILLLAGVLLAGVLPAGATAQAQDKPDPVRKALADKAHVVCPYSHAIRRNVDVTTKIV